MQYIFSNVNSSKITCLFLRVEGCNPIKAFVNPLGLGVQLQTFSKYLSSWKVATVCWFTIKYKPFKYAHTYAHKHTHTLTRSYTHAHKRAHTHTPHSNPWRLYKRTSSDATRPVDLAPHSHDTVSTWNLTI